MILSTPENNVAIKLSPNDMKVAVEFWLNQQILQSPCIVTEISTITAHGGTFKITFTRHDEKDNGRQSDENSSGSEKDL